MLDLDYESLRVLQGREQWDAQVPMLVEGRLAHNKLAAVSNKAYRANQMATNKEEFLAKRREIAARHRNKPESKAARKAFDATRNRP